MPQFCASLGRVAFAKSGSLAHACEDDRAMTTYAGKRLGKIIHAVASGPVLVVPVNRNSIGRKSCPVAAVPQLAVVVPRMPVSRFTHGVFGHIGTERQVPDSTECRQRVSACFASLMAGITGSALSFWFTTFVPTLARVTQIVLCAGISGSQLCGSG